jgi:hypothetical protein
MRLFRVLRKRTRRSLLLTSIGVMGGYFLDPQMGAARRRRAANWARQLPAVGRRFAKPGAAGDDRRDPVEVRSVLLDNVGR